MMTKDSEPELIDGVDTEAGHVTTVGGKNSQLKRMEAEMLKFWAPTLFLWRIPGTIFCVGIAREKHGDILLKVADVPVTCTRPLLSLNS
ncbi:hypothetical protein MKW98_000797 [Papaver atlanticum]|uniref:Uncharacterized protein n=1 Tax=Papaver atlanticum TaxID=357466 RepID=A0AAD4XCA7_9MAGN|nr:hypothetical protein MKW98_000797 [Papaver atlanticum]